MIVDVSSQYIENLCQWWRAPTTDMITDIDDCSNGFYMDILTRQVFAIIRQTGRKAMVLWWSNITCNTMAFLPVCLIMANTQRVTYLPIRSQILPSVLTI